MKIEKYFIEEGMKQANIEYYLKNKFDRAGFSHIEIQRTPLGTRIIVFANKPGLVIGKSGRIIKEITDEIKEKFKLENPMLDVKEVENPFLDAQVVADRIAKSIERGAFYKKVVNWYLSEIMKAGAIGVEIKVGGKLGGERGRFQKFKEGYIKHSGYYADNILDRGMAKATVKLGIIGVQVKIMKTMPEDLATRIIEEEKPIEGEIEVGEEKPKVEKPEKKKVEKKKVIKKKAEPKKKVEKKKPTTKKRVVTEKVKTKPKKEKTKKESGKVENKRTKKTKR